MYFFATDIWLVCMQNGSFDLLFIVFSNFCLYLFSLIKVLHSSTEISRVLEIVLIFYSFPVTQITAAFMLSSILSMIRQYLKSEPRDSWLVFFFLWNIPEKYSKISWSRSLFNSKSIIKFLYAWLLLQPLVTPGWRGPSISSSDSAKGCSLLW